MSFQLADNMSVDVIDKNTNKIFFKADTIPIDNFVIYEDKKARVIKLDIGTKVEVRESTYKQIIGDKIITDKYNLEIKRLNRWWYSVCFGEK